MARLASHKRIVVVNQRVFYPEILQSRIHFLLLKLESIVLDRSVVQNKSKMKRRYLENLTFDYALALYNYQMLLSHLPGLDSNKSTPRIISTYTFTKSIVQSFGR